MTSSEGVLVASTLLNICAAAAAAYYGHEVDNYFAPSGRGAEYCHQCVCLSVRSRLYIIIRL